MKVYAISDTHFGHDKLKELTFRPDDFGAKILKNISKKTGDLLIHCGDFCIGDDELHHQAFMAAAKGFKKKILVKGNHDKKSDAWYMEHGWDFVCDVFWNRYFGKDMFFSHQPMTGLSYGLYSMSFHYNIHGHLHGKGMEGHHQIDNYNPAWHIDLAPEIRLFDLVNIETVSQGKLRP